MMIAVSCAVQGPTAIEKRKQAKPRPGHGCCACVHKKQAADKRGGQHWPRPLFTVASTGNAFNQLLLLPLHSLQSQLVHFAEGKKKTILFFKKHF
jgi:hypothetical protein